MLITGLEQDGFWHNVELTGIEKKEDIYSLFQAVTNIIDDGSRLVGIWITLKNGVEIRLH
jgi:hypothetical protein